MYKALLILALAFCSIGHAQEKGFTFLRVGTTARPVALGDAYVARPGDISTFMYNPASVAGIEKRQASASYLDYLLDIGAGNLTYGQPIQDLGVVGASLIFFNFGDFEGADAAGNLTGNFGAHSYAFNVFYANSLRPNLQYGITLKYTQFRIDDYSSSAIAADLGVLYAIPWKGVTVGASLLNIGQVTDAFISRKDPLPLALQFGASKKLERAPITFSASFSEVNRTGSFGDRLKRFVIGAELEPRENMFLRAGYNNQRHTDLALSDGGFMNRIAGFSAGFGILYDRFNFDYAFSSWGIGTLNRFSFAARF